MRAWVYSNAGGVEVLSRAERPTPTPRGGEVRVRVAWSAVNPTDVKRRTSGRELAQLREIIPNNDGAGVVDAVGPGVHAGRLGERVWLFGAQAGRAGGTAAEFVCVPSAQAQTLPEETPLSVGACLGVPAVTGHRALTIAGEVDGRDGWVLVVGAAGRVGRAALELALWSGARVAATARRNEDLAALEALGPDVALSHDAGVIRDWMARAAPEGVSRIIDPALGANIDLYANVLAANGVIASYASDAAPHPRIPFEALMRRGAALRFVSIYAMPAAARRSAFQAIAAALAENALTPRIAARCDFDALPDAHQTVADAAARGCVLVAVDPSLD